MRFRYLLITLLLFTSVFGYYKEDCFSGDYFYYVNKVSPIINITVVPGVNTLYVKNATFYSGENLTNLTLVNVFQKNYFLSKGYKLELNFGDVQSYSFNVSLKPNQLGFFKFNILDSEGRPFNSYIGDKLEFFLRYNATPPHIVNYVNGETIPVIGANQPALNFEFSKPISYYQIEIKPSDRSSFETVDVFHNKEVCVKNIKSSATLITSDLKDNVYDLKIIYKDLYGNQNISHFVIYREATPLKLTLVSKKDNKQLGYFFSENLPNYSNFFNGTIFSRKDYINLTLRTNKPSKCFYADYLLSFQPARDLLSNSSPIKFHTKDGVVHWLKVSVPKEGKKFEVFCKSLTTGEVVYLNDLFDRPSRLLLLRRYSGKFDYIDYFPKDLVSTRSFTVFAKTSKRAVCGYSFDSMGLKYLSTDDFIRHTDIYSLGKGNYNFTLLCVNEVGETISKKGMVDVDPNSLIGILDYSPKVVGTTPVNISILFNGQPGSCKFSSSDVDVSNFSSLTGILKDTDNPSRKTFGYNFPKEGTNEIYILCNESGFVSKGSIRVFFDKTGPVGNSLYFLNNGRKTDYINNVNDFRIGYNFSSLLGIDHYVVDVLEGSDVVKEFTTGTDSYRVIGNFGNLTGVRVTAVDNLGKNSSLSKEIKVDSVAPMVVISFDGKAVRIACTDDKSGCKDVRYGLSKVPNIGCMPSESYNFTKPNEIYVGDDISFVCVEAYDQAGNKAFATKIIRTNLVGNESRNATVNSSLVDSDGDGMPDVWEEKYGLNKYDPSDANLDPDGDNLTNLEEYKLGTDPLKYDTDGDGYGDGYEVEHGTDPLDPNDYPGMNVTNSSGVNSSNQSYAVQQPYSYNGTYAPSTSESSGFNYTLLVALVLVVSCLGGGGYYSYKKGYLDSYLKKINLGPSSSSSNKESEKGFYKPVVNEGKVERHINRIKDFVKKREDEIAELVKGISSNTKSKPSGEDGHRKNGKIKKGKGDLLYDVSNDVIGAKMEDVAKEAEKFEEFYRKKKGQDKI